MSIPRGGHNLLASLYPVILMKGSCCGALTSVGVWDTAGVNKCSTQKHPSIVNDDFQDWVCGSVGRVLVYLS